MDLGQVTANDVRRIVQRVRAMDVDLKGVSPKTFGYSSACLCCIDAALSINRRYDSFVVPRVKTFARLYPDVTTLGELIRRIEAVGPRQFGEVALSYHHEARIVTLYDLARRAAYLSQQGWSGRSELVRLRHWAAQAGPMGNVELGVKGIGFTTYQYLRMLLGVSTVKPDVHIGRFVEESVGRRVPQTSQVVLLERVANVMRVSATALDHAIWRYYARRVDYQACL